MKTVQRALSMLLAACMLFILAPLTTSAANSHKVAIYMQQSGMGTADTNGVVSGTYYLVNSDGSLNTEGAGESNYNIYYDEEAARLTINNLQVTSNKSLFVPGGTTINVLGTNKIEKAEGSSSGGGIGVISNGNVTITGTGSLYISSQSQRGIYRGYVNNTGWTETQGDVVINGDIKLKIDHVGAASCISATNNITIGGNARVDLDPRAGTDKDNNSITYYNGGNIIIQDNAQVTSTGGLDTTGTNTSGEYGKILITGTSSLTVTDADERSAALRGYGGIELSENARLNVSSNTKSGQAIVAPYGAIKIAGEAEVNMINDTPLGNTALYAKDMEITGKLTVKGGTNGLSLNGGNTILFDGADVKISNCMIGVTSQAEIANSLVEIDTTLKAFGSTANASLTDDNGKYIYDLYAGDSKELANFVSPDDEWAMSAAWGRKYVRTEAHACTYNQQVISDVYKASDASCTAPAAYYYSCLCGEKGTETFTVGTALGHSWNAWTTNGNGTHTRSCSVCPQTETADCVGGTATCTAPAICEVCGQPYGEKDAENHTDLVKTEAEEATHFAEGNTEYWYCSDCGKYFSDEAAGNEIELEDTIIPKLPEYPPAEKDTEGGKDAVTPENPQTGDSSNIVLWIAVMLAAGTALTFTAFYNRKKKYSR